MFPNQINIEKCWYFFLFFLKLIHWIVVIYLVDTDSVIQPLNNWGQYVKS